jgi:ribosomal protein S17E
VNIDIQINKISIDQISQILEGLKYYWIREKRNAAVNSTSIYAPIVKAIAEKFNEYNKSNFTVDQAKNKVIAVIRYASSDLRNLQASEVPMISKAVNDCIKNSQ